ncbi:hypothetical protein ACFOU0_11190 [Salinicoccus sesuvii]|uniref:Broad-specificity ulvan lyase N-terminal domain-containing protein n=1 Tax=Salinicoccus sesuvii TaxID=868281 RepID=A0ABV7N6B9_9STAP
MKDIMQHLFNAVANESRIDANQVELNERKYRVNRQYTVFLSVREDNSKAYIVRGQAAKFSDAVNQALDIYVSKKPVGFKPKHLKLDIVNGVKPFKNRRMFDYRKDTLLFDKGNEGVTFGKTLQTAFLPSEMIGYDIVENRKVNINNLNAAVKQKLNDDSYNQLKSPFKFSTDAFYSNGNDYYPLTRGHRVFREIDKDTVLYAIQLTKNNYFKQVVNSRGKFIYTYLPAVDYAEKKYNILRHAGTIFSMLQTYELTQDEEIMNRAKKALSFLVDKVEIARSGQKGKVLVERDTAKLGGNGLAIVALAKYTEITGDRKYLPVMQELAEWIKDMQIDSGDFKAHKLVYSTGEISDFVSDFYIGESILALTKLHALDGNLDWIDVAENAADYLINTKNKDATTSTIQHDHWLLYGLNGLYRVRQKEMYIKHALMMAESIMDTQYLSEQKNDIEFIGGYPPQVGTLPKSVPVACRTEGLSNAYELAKDYGYEEEAKRMREAIIKGVQFQLQTQLREESVMHFENHSLCIGAFYNKFKDITIRNDFTQHNISACIACYKIM